MPFIGQNEPDLQSEEAWFSSKKSLLIIGFLLLLFSNMRGSAGIFAWLMPIPFLIYIVRFVGIKNHLWLLLALIMGSILSFIKAVSDPLIISVGFSIMIGIVIGLRYYLSFLLWHYIRKWGGEVIGLVAFPAIIVSLEYFQAFYLPFGDWGSMSNTQLYNLPFLQTASLFGFLGISAVMAWAAVLGASLLLKGSLAKSRNQLLLFVLVFAALNIYGDLRLNKVLEGKHVRAAVIMGDYKFTGTIPNPEDTVVIKATKVLIEKTRIAAERGADMVLVPGMDWRGVLMQHTLMTRIRAIEGGFSVLRAGNEATSMGFDNYGQIRAAMTDFGENDKILIASLPVQKIKTLYSSIGNLIAYLAIVTLLLSFLIAVHNHKKST